MQNFEEDDDSITGINVTPLVDISLVLLIIFMVTASFIVEPSIKVDLPKATTGDANPEFTAFITINTKNELFLNGQADDGRQDQGGTGQDYTGRSRTCRRRSPADKNVTHGEFVRILDLVRTVGITKLGIGTTEE